MQATEDVDNASSERCPAQMTSSFQCLWHYIS